MQIETQQKWSAIIAEQQASHLTVVEFCQQAQIATSTFYQRRRELAKTVEPTTTFVRAKLTDAITLVEKTIPEPIELTAGQVRLSLPGNTSSGYLTQLIKGINA